MATQKISEMTETIILQDEDYVPIVQSELNKKIKIEYLRDYNKLHNKPTLNGVTIENNKKLSDYNVVKANQGIKVNSSTNQTLELEVPTNQELEQRSDVNKAITIATADKMAKETAHQIMSKEYQPNSQDNLAEGENQPVSYKAVKDYVDVLENKVDENERDIEDKVQKLDEKTAAKDSELESLITTNEQDIEQKYTTLNQKVEQNKQTTDSEIQQLKSKDSELENLISTNEEDIESKVQELDNKKLNKEETPKTLPNPNKLIFTGAVSDEYDGSVEKTISIPEGGSDYALPQASEELLGGIKAKAKTVETVEVVIDTETGKLYVPTYPESSGSGGVGLQFKLIETVESDGQSVFYSKQLTDLTDGYYMLDFFVTQDTAENAGQTIYGGCGFNITDIFNVSYRTAPVITRKDNFPMWARYIFAYFNGKIYVLAETKSSIVTGTSFTNGMFYEPSVASLNTLVIYSQNSKEVPNGSYIKLYKIGDIVGD